MAAGSALDVQDNEQHYTPLMDAVREDNKSVVILLLAAGADVSLKDKWHKTALDIARNRHLKDIIDLIEKTKIVQ